MEEGAMEEGMEEGEEEGATQLLTAGSCGRRGWKKGPPSF
jgi:hypothetical protein